MEKYKITIWKYTWSNNFDINTFLRILINVADNENYLIIVHGNYTNWTTWSPCSQSCGNGTQFRERFCANPTPRYGGNDCHNLGEQYATQNCFNSIKCPSKSFKFCSK